MTPTGTSGPPRPSQGRSQWAQILSSRKTILLLLFCATGFLGLPLLWMSHAFTMSEKVIISALNILYTCALIGVAAWACYWCYQRIQEAGIL